MSRIFISGAHGFIGQHLHAALLAKGHKVDGPSFELENENSVRAALGSEAYDAVIHLAGISHVGECEKDPAHAREVNVEGSKRLFKAVNATSPACHFVFASTAQVYEAPRADEAGHEVEFGEDRTIRPQNLYAQTKWEVEEYLKAAVENSSPAVTILRFFNHTHKSQSPRFFLPHVYQQLLEAQGNSKPLRIPVGNLDLKRDIGSVRDLVAAVDVALQQRRWKFETFNVCSGVPKHLGSLAEELRQRLDANAEFCPEESRMRPGEPLVLKGSHKKLSGATGWAPRVRSESELIDDFLRD